MIEVGLPRPADPPRRPAGSPAGPIARPAAALRGPATRPAAPLPGATGPAGDGAATAPVLRASPGHGARRDGRATSPAPRHRGGVARLLAPQARTPGGSAAPGRAARSQAGGAGPPRVTTEGAERPDARRRHRRGRRPGRCGHRPSPAGAAPPASRGRKRGRPRRPRHRAGRRRRAVRGRRWSSSRAPPTTDVGRQPARDRATSRVERDVPAPGDRQRPPSPATGQSPSTGSSSSGGLRGHGPSARPTAVAARRRGASPPAADPASALHATREHVVDDDHVGRHRRQWAASRARPASVPRVGRLRGVKRARRPRTGPTDGGP